MIFSISRMDFGDNFQSLFFVKISRFFVNNNNTSVVSMNIYIHTISFDITFLTNIKIHAFYSTINGSIRLKSARKSSQQMTDNFPSSRLFPRLFHQQWALLKLVADQRYPFFSSSTGKYRLRNCIRIMRKLFHRWSSFPVTLFSTLRDEQRKDRILKFTFLSRF